MLRFDRDVAVIELEPFDNFEELRGICNRLSRKTATGELKGVILDLQGNALPGLELARELYYLHMIRQRSRRYHPGSFGRNPFVVLCNPDPGRFGQEAGNGFVKPFPVVASVDNGIAMILSHHDVFPGPSDSRSTISPGNLIRIFAVGCAEKNLSDVPDQLRKAGFEVADSAADVVSDGDHVLFCLSCAHGPTAGTERSVLGCSGREIVPVGVVKNFSDVVEFDSLMELVSMEMNILLAKILPEDLIERLPSFYDFDLDLPAKIADRLKQNLDSIRCK